MHTTSAQHIHI